MFGLMNIGFGGILLIFGFGFFIFMMNSFGFGMLDNLMKDLEI